MNPSPGSGHERLFAGDGEMARRMREFDWGKSAIGPVSSWSPTLRVMVPFLLANRFPLLLWWGPEYIQLYNDAYAPILGKKHPERGLGVPTHECWTEIWHVLKPLVDVPFQGGPATWVEDLELEIHRHGFLEETHFTVAYSAVPDEAAPGGIGGVLATVHETTRQVVQERRVVALRDLAGASVGRTAEEACQAAAQALGRHAKDVPFALLYLLDADRAHAQLVSSAGIEPVACASVVELDAPAARSAWPLAEVYRTGKPLFVGDIARFCDPVPQGPWGDPPTQAMVLPIPSSVPPQLAGFLVVGVSSRLAFDDLYESFFQLAASPIATAIANARAFEQERARSEALAELDRAKTTFFSNVSHEFRTPLTLMLGPLEDALADTGLPPVERERLDVAHRNSLRLLKLVNTLLDFSRIEAGRIRATYEETDLCAFTEELVGVFRAAVERAGLTLEVSYERGKAPVFVDREMWEKVVLNLLSNAFKFTFEGGIVVRVEEHGESIVTTVRDTGIGIPEGELPHVFERFHRVHGAAGRTHEGTGIGLALVHELVKLHGGTVVVASELGRGTTFTVSIPTGAGHLAAERIGAARALSSTALGAAPFVEEALRWLPEQDGTRSNEVVETRLRIPTQGARVLVADDNQDLRDYLRRLLSVHWRVDAVADGEAALAAVRSNRPDLVLTDVMMPKLDGFGLLQALRDDPATRTIPCILLSARADEEAALEGLGAGADDFMTKPFSARELLARVNANLVLARFRAQADAHVRHRGAQFETLLNAAPLGVFLVDSSFKLREVNPVAMRAVGGGGDLVGRDFDELIHLVWDDVYADQIVAHFRETLETGVPHIEPERGERRRNGGRLEYYEWQINRIPLPDGSHGVVCYFRDISARVEARNRLAESELRFRTLADNAPALIWVNGVDGCEFVNRRYLEFLDVGMDEVKGYGWAPYVHPDDRDGYMRAFLEAMQELRPFEADFRFRRHDGEYRWMRSSGHPRMDSSGALLGYVGISEDITDRKRTESEREELLAVAERARGEAEVANRAKDEFLAVLSHELRSPMNAMLGWVRILKSAGTRDPALLSKASDTIERNIWIQAQVINDLLDVSRIMSGKLQLERERVDVGAVVTGCVESLRPSADGKQVALHLDLAPHGIDVMGDGARLQQVVGNLLGNAIKFTGPGGSISVKADAVGRQVRIVVEDTGLGIEPEFLPHLFERFRQADSSTARKHGGLGLGLAIVKNVVELHGGTVVAESEGPGRGARFTVMLPAADERARMTYDKARPATSWDEGAGLGPLDILLVEDEADSREALELAFHSVGARVRCAASVRLALEAYEERRPDLMISDIGMPGEDGYVLIKAIREREEGKPHRTLAIAMTGFAGRQDREMALRAGFDEHVAKPVDLDLLFERVRVLEASRGNVPRRAKNPAPG